MSSPIFIIYFGVGYNPILVYFVAYFVPHLVIVALHVLGRRKKKNTVSGPSPFKFIFGGIQFPKPMSPTATSGLAFSTDEDVAPVI